MAWGSHLPVLLAAIGATGGPVLELGVGHFSTPHLHALCGAMGRKLVSIEDNDSWSATFGDMYEDANHIFIKSGYPDAIAKVINRSWSVVFIDHSPGGKNRADAFSAFIDRSVFVVVHDYHLENEEAIKPLLVGLPSCHVAATYQPPTLIASKGREIPYCIRCL